METMAATMAMTWGRLQFDKTSLTLNASASGANGFSRNAALPSAFDLDDSSLDQALR